MSKMVSTNVSQFAPLPQSIVLRPLLATGTVGSSRGWRPFNEQPQDLAHSVNLQSCIMTSDMH
eukprot:1137365-Amphidinium_carterae.1